MQKLKRWLEKVYDRRIENEYDNVVLVIADEGDGKSNLMVGLQWWWRDIRGYEPTTEDVLEQLVFDREDFEDAMSGFERQSAIACHDAARILHKKKAMHPEQIEVETDLFDVRTKEHLMLLGFQEWDSVPSSLQKRRARHALYIPSRGRVWGYSRDTLDQRVGSDHWPDPDLRDTFPALDSVDAEIADCWAEFQALDLRKKQERIDSSEGDEDDDDDELSVKAVAEEIKHESLEQFISHHGRTGEPYVDDELINIEYDLSVRESRQVRKLLERDAEVNQRLQQQDAPEGTVDA